MFCPSSWNQPLVVSSSINFERVGGRYCKQQGVLQGWCEGGVWSEAVRSPCGHNHHCGGPLLQRANPQIGESRDIFPLMLTIDPQGIAKSLSSANNQDWTSAEDISFKCDLQALKSSSDEYSRILDLVGCYAIFKPEVGFTVKKQVTPVQAHTTSPHAKAS